MRLVCMVAALVWSQGLVVAWASPGRQAVVEAVEQYTEAMDTPGGSQRLERFRTAQRLFERAVESQGVENAELYAALGNAALQGRRLGPAVLAYRRALALAPGHAQARKNLDCARRLLPDWVPRPASGSALDTFFVWQRTVSHSGRLLAASCCFAVMAVTGFVAVRWRRAWARAAGVALLAVWLSLMGVPVWQWVSGGEDAEGVVTGDDVVARSADSDGAPPRFSQPLPAGTEVQLVEQREGWIRLRLANGLLGWVRASAVTRVTR